MAQKAKRAVSEVVKGRILELRAKGKQPAEILETLRSSSKGLTPAKIAYVIRYYGSDKGTKAKNGTGDESLLVHATAADAIIKMIKLVAFNDGITAETRLKMIKEVFSE